MTIASNFLNNIQTKSKDLSKTIRATKMFSDLVDAKTAIVSIISYTGIAGFKFHCPDREEVLFQSDVTDHYIETNTPVADHIAQKPVRITLRGFQGDYFHTVHPIQSFLAAVPPVLKVCEDFLPKLTKLTMFKKTISTKPTINVNGNFTFSATVDKTDFNTLDLFTLFQSLVKLTSAQTRAFYFLETLWKAKARFSVETTWKRYDNMVITDLKPIRDNNADITDFTVTFKQISFTESRVIDLNNDGRAQQQKSSTVNKGLDKG